MSVDLLQTSLLGDALGFLAVAVPASLRNVFLVLLISAGGVAGIGYVASGARRWHSHAPSAHPFRDWLRHAVLHSDPPLDETSGIHLVLNGALCLVATGVLLLVYLL